MKDMEEDSWVSNCFKKFKSTTCVASMISCVEEAKAWFSSKCQESKEKDVESQARYVTIKQEFIGCYICLEIAND